MDQSVRRRAARVVCLDPHNRFFLLHWRDPGTGQRFWEPPGGGVEAGESDLAAARRELEEETGLVGAIDDSWAVEVERDFDWNGRRFCGPERFYGLEVAAATEPRPGGLTESETAALLGHGWFSTKELLVLEDRVEPPELAEIVASLVKMRAAGTA